MLGLCLVAHSRTQVPSNGSFEHFQQESEHRTSQRGVPSALGAFVADESVLGLYLDELQSRIPVSLERGQFEFEKDYRRTVAVTLASSRVLRMRSRPSRGTCVSCFPKIIYSNESDPDTSVPDTTSLGREDAENVPQLLCLLDRRFEL